MLITKYKDTVCNTLFFEIFSVSKNVRFEVGGKRTVRKLEMRNEWSNNKQAMTELPV